MTRHTPEIARRNAAIIEAYRAGATQADLERQFGLTRSWIGRILKRAGALRDHRQEHREQAIRRWRSGVYHNVEFRRGRKPYWPDCPPHLAADYRNLRRYMPAREARAILEGAR